MPVSDNSGFFLFISYNLGLGPLIFGSSHMGDSEPKGF